MTEFRRDQEEKKNLLSFPLGKKEKSFSKGGKGEVDYVEQGGRQEALEMQ